MNYIGSKCSLLPFIHSVIKKTVGNNLSDKVFCDIFAGTGTVGRSFKGLVKKIISNDCEYYSYVLNKNYIANNEEIKDKDEYIRKLNLVPPISDGYIYINYCLGGGNGRQYFSDYNGMKIDAMRQQIEKWKTEKKINDNLYYFLLCSLLESADRYANTACVYGAFLKHLKKTAAQQLILIPANYEFDSHVHEVYRENANTLIKRIEGDLLYFDPPYNNRQYGANYHLLNTIAEYKPFVPQGKTGLGKYYKSLYCRPAFVETEFEELVKNASFKYIFLSYNNEGLMSMETIRKIMSKYGKYDLAQQKYQRFKADKTENRHHKAKDTVEYLHILEKNN